jgi:hypothetical protein
MVTGENDTDKHTERDGESYLDIERKIQRGKKTQRGILRERMTYVTIKYII